MFSVAHGHTYIQPKSRKSENAPSPRQTATNPTVDFLNTLSLTHRHGAHFMDESPLAGEPGSFRVTKNRELAHSQVTEAPINSQVSEVPTSVPTPDAKELKVSTNVAPEAKPTTKTPTGKLKRRKSRPAND